MLRLPAIFLLAAACSAAYAVTQEEVVAGADHLYRQRLAEHEQRYALDADPAFLARVKRIADILILQSRHDFPEALTWTWEIHTTSDDDENAFCMAGGKLLIGQPFVTHLGLDDAELAMLLSHEMQHALQQHNRKEYDEALRLEPVFMNRSFATLEGAVDNDAGLMRKLEGFNANQEIEADREGMKLAWRAGWPARRLANYFKKMMRTSAYPNFERAGYPSPSQRWRIAQDVAAMLDGAAPPRQ
jgi:predicted Zn-dependent protease